MPSLPQVFTAPDAIYRPDTCEPLKQAAAAGTIRLHACGRAGYPGPRIPAPVLRGLRSVGSLDATDDQRWGLAPHRNEGIELMLLERGRCAFAVGDQRWSLPPGAVTITRPWQEHRVGDPHLAACRLHWLIIDVGIRRPDQDWRWPPWIMLSAVELARLTALLRHNDDPVIRAGDALIAPFAALAADLALAGDDAGRWTRLRLRINGILLALLDHLERQRRPLDAALASRQKTVAVFLDGLSRHLGEPWTLGEMAAQCGLSRTRFAHYCRQLTNATPLEYLARLRIAGACRRLRDLPAASITAIALECGFGSSQHFAGAFRKAMGMSARDWRRGAGTRRSGAGQPTPSAMR